MELIHTSCQRKHEWTLKNRPTRIRIVRITFVNTLKMTNDKCYFHSATAAAAVVVVDERMNEWMNWMAKRHNLWHNLAPFPNRVTISVLLFIKIVNTIKRWILRDCLIHFGICYLSRPSPADVLLRLKSNEWHQRLWSTWNKINWC